MNERIIVLRAVDRKPSPTTSTVPFGSTPPRPVPTLRVDRIAADARELPAIRQEKQVLAAAVALPLRLYQPVRTSEDSTDGVPLWGLDAVGATGPTGSLLAGTGATVAILDSGIDAEHEAFRELRSKEAIVQQDFTGEGDGDSLGHGTHCAGTVFGGKVGGRRIGVAPKVWRALIGKVLGNGAATTESLVDAIAWACREGANVVSMSLGIDIPRYVTQLTAEGYAPDAAMSKGLEAYCHTLELFEVVVRRAELSDVPVVFVAAAGNSSRAAGPLGYVIGLEPPAAAGRFVSVSAVERSEEKYRLADFSNGPAILSAPGVGILSAKAGPMHGAMSVKSGTSMAVPHVAGVAALWYESLLQTVGTGFTSELLRSKLIGSGRLKQVDAARVRDAGCGVVHAPVEQP